MGIKVTVPPGSEPVSLSELKAQLRIPDSYTNDDTYLNSLITASRQFVELYLRRQLLTATLVLTMDRFPWSSVTDPINQISPRYDNTNYYYGTPEIFAIWPPRPPLISVTSIQYTDQNNTLQTLDSGAYVVDTNNEPGRIAPVYGRFWPGTVIQPNVIIITYQAGYGAATDVPEPIKMGIKLVAMSLYDGVTLTQSSLPKAAEMLLYPYRALDERVLEYA